MLFIGAALVLPTREAAIDFVPLLFIVYVAYAIISAIVKAAKQAQQTQASASSSDAPAMPAMTADQVRAALLRRRAAMASKLAPPTPVVSSMPAPIVIVSPPARDALPDLVAPSLDQFGLQSPVSGAGGTANVDLQSLLAGLPPAAQAVLASAVIGPCAAHRGAGHTPEDW